MKYWCDFSASILIEAKDEAEAAWEFWKIIHKTDFQFCELVEVERDDNNEKMVRNLMCPIEDYNCPYCNANGECMMDRPQDECDDFMAAYADITIDKEE